MRILHVIVTLDPSWGGPPRVAVRMAAAQALLGHDVSVISYGGKDMPQAVKQMSVLMPGFEHVRLDYIDRDTWSEWLFAGCARAAVRARLPSTDVVHIHNIWHSINLAAASEARRSGVPYVVEPNGILDRWCMEQSRLKKQLALQLAFRRMLDGAAALCLGNEAERIAIEPLGLKARPVVVPLNAVFPEEFLGLPEKGRFVRSRPELEGRPFIVFLGRLHYKKGLDFLADAFGEFARTNPEPHLVVVGHDEGAQADFETRIRSHGVEKRVHLLGPLHGDRKWEVFRDADCFALPSRQEGFSIAITEALACGLPVVISDECHFPEVAQAGAGVVVPLETSAIAAGFARIFASQSERLSMAQAARQLVATQFNCRTVAKTLVSAYSQLKGGGNADQKTARERRQSELVAGGE